jgi:hypothetical protein
LRGQRRPPGRFAWPAQCICGDDPRNAVRRAMQRRTSTHPVRHPETAATSSPPEDIDGVDRHLHRSISPPRPRRRHCLPPLIPFSTPTTPRERRASPPPPVPPPPDLLTLDDPDAASTSIATDLANPTAAFTSTSCTSPTAACAWTPRSRIPDDPRRRRHSRLALSASPDLATLDDGAVACTSTSSHHALLPADDRRVGRHRVDRWCGPGCLPSLWCLPVCRRCLPGDMSPQEARA